MDNIVITAQAGEQKSQVLHFTQPGSYTITLDLTEPNSGIEVQGVYKMAADEKLSITIIQRHTAPSTKSSVLIKGLVYDQAQVQYHGTIILSKDAQHAQAAQFNKNLLFGELARVRSSPNLEIHNNKVQCKHGSAVGKLDATALFYLQSRGVPMVDARNLLIDAFMAL